MATVTFTAILPSGEAVTRTSGTMPYVAISVGSQIIWHKSFAAAHKAATSRQQTWNTNGVPAQVIPALPTAINGKIDADFAQGGWGDIPESALQLLVEAKLGGKPVNLTPKGAQATGGNSAAHDHRWTGQPVVPAVATAEVVETVTAPAKPAWLVEERTISPSIGAKVATVPGGTTVTLIRNEGTSSQATMTLTESAEDALLALLLERKAARAS
jgi:hypothetical protein